MSSFLKRGLISATFNKSLGTVMSKTINERVKNITATAKKRGKTGPRNAVEKSSPAWAWRLALRLLAGQASLVSGDVEPFQVTEGKNNAAPFPQIFTELSTTVANKFFKEPFLIVIAFQSFDQTCQSSVAKHLSMVAEIHKYHDVLFSGSSDGDSSSPTFKGRKHTAEELQIL